MQHANLREIQYLYHPEKETLAINVCYKHSHLPTAQSWKGLLLFQQCNSSSFDFTLHAVCVRWECHVGS